MATEHYHLLVTAGSSYDVNSHQLVHVNTSNSIQVRTEHISASINVRIRNYKGLPSNSPESCAYFNTEEHKHDLYSISFRFRLLNATTSSNEESGDIASDSDGTKITGNNLIFGNDFENPIRDHLPPGFGTAFRIVKWAIDPGIDGDVYADKPYLYGPLLSSINTLYVRSSSETSTSSAMSDSEAWTEGGSDKGLQLRHDHHVPDDVAGRRKHFLTESNRQAWHFSPNEEYTCDFFNPYLDFNEFSLKLPGFTLGIMRYWDGQPLRYVLKHRSKDGGVDQVLFVVQFTLVKDEDVEDVRRKWEGEAISKKEEGKGEESGYVDEGVD